MQNAERNPTQAQQRDMAARSPVKTPAAGDFPDASAQAKQFGSTSHASSAEPRAVKPEDVTPTVPPKAKEDCDHVLDANRRIVSLDVMAMAATDDTVDADGKCLEAAREESAWHDNIISSNATLENNVPVPADGLGGFDSRRFAQTPPIATAPGYRVTTEGKYVSERRNGSRTETVFSLESGTPREG